MAPCTPRSPSRLLCHQLLRAEVDRCRQGKGRPPLAPGELPSSAEVYAAWPVLDMNPGPAVRAWREKQQQLTGD